MTNVIRRVDLRWWRVLTIAFAVALYIVATSDHAYLLTSPPGLSFHTALRKTYALGAFALIGFLLANANVPRVREPIAIAVAVGLYSYAIEIGQIVIHQSRETFAQHAFDVASGVGGGLLGALVALAFQPPPAAVRSRDVAIAAVLLLALVAAFTVTYA